MPLSSIQTRSAEPQSAPTGDGYVRGMERLITAVQELSLARDLETVRAIVRHAARELTGADGATFILRDGDRCYYMDEDAIGPLWKGKRFPMSACISGWSMIHKQPVVLADIYADPRIPAEAYRPTFVKSLAMVPIRTSDPIGAIGNYWAAPHAATPHEVKLLQALADSTSVALENVQVYSELEKRVRDRTVQLEATNKELEAFSYSVSHDLRAPLRTINGFARILQNDHGVTLAPEGRDCLERVCRAAERMDALIVDLLNLARVTRTESRRDAVNLGAIALDVVATLNSQDTKRRVDFVCAPDLMVHGDAHLLKIALENLLGNAWKFTARQATARIELGVQPGSPPVYFVRDNGAGFDMTYAAKLFAPFQRLHSADEFPGTGIGLATVLRIVRKHGGRIWAEGRVGEGATISFTLTEETPGA